MSSLYFRAKLVKLPDGSLVDPATIEMIEPMRRTRDVTSGKVRVERSVKVTFRSGRFRILEGVTIEEIGEMLQGQAISSEDEEPEE